MRLRLWALCGVEEGKEDRGEEEVGGAEQGEGGGGEGEGGIKAPKEEER